MPNISNTPTAGLRLVSMLTDHFIMTFAIVISSFILCFPLTLFSKENVVPELYFFGSGLFGTIVFILVSLYFNKDILNGRSPAKRILKLQVVDNTSNLTAKPIKCLLRNLTIIIWPIEVIVTIFNPTQRLGDRLANTKVVFYDEAKEKEGLDKSAIAKALLLGLVLFSGVLILGLLFNLGTH